ncbi:MAG: hypothetical protein UT68_C0001G0110 [Parcubacteria group bacterium GW2011_GWC2_40_10]|nr:MAG: hypothetical protein UT25_C0001G0108 [Parcubacteria group bacterium GW2011_GWC1_39_12]KKR19632.1 MAG: hypothetical protein UT49_C0001G0108 [Parcubacteria group bacterium GW2011_GWF1_39_37]KKR35787.1 MAG: hypothetical protein UT68_C0001G0110 [Parcubacteria group bacterium GW2011_GWC2_40_10]KKR52600.1 MAG: hypothetical protein UT89_C0001G0108 [Parcubacteria group bacterium GW2011_GWE1_40_20]KKR66052.1 MAG: hypothetical protein UU06_C0006G0003 [Parcubacteria group bacterium GW2011_GWB1_40_
MEAKFTGRWDDLLIAMERCVENCGVMRVALTDGEYKRLMNPSAMDELRRRMSTELSERVMLQMEWSGMSPMLRVYSTVQRPAR